MMTRQPFGIIGSYCGFSREFAKLKTPIPFKLLRFASPGYIIRGNPNNTLQNTVHMLCSNSEMNF